MKLKKMIIQGFRSYDEEVSVEFDDLTTLIGNNGAGKTTALIALNKMFSSNPADRVIYPSDFYISSNEAEEDHRDLMCEAVFEIDGADSDTNQRTEASFLSRLSVKEENGNLCLHIRLRAEWNDDGGSDGTVESQIYFVTPSADSENGHESVAPRRELNLIRMIYVPAVRNPDKQLGVASNSLLSRLVRSVNWGPKLKDEIDNQLEDLNETLLNADGTKLINETLSADWGKYYQDKRFSKVQLTIDSTSLGELAKRIRTSFQSTVTGRSFRPEEMGDGTRSLFYISNVASVLDIENNIISNSTHSDDNPIINHRPPLLTLVAIEEPENHISPHLLGKLVERLKVISDLDNAQVILTSHSPAIVKRIKPEGIRFVRLDPAKGFSCIKPLRIPDKDDKVAEYKYIKLAVQLYPELYFAQLVVLGEGASEEILLPRFLEITESSLDAAGISFVPLAGRFVHYIWILLKQLGVPFITLLDLDRERNGGGWGRVGYILKELQSFGDIPLELPLGITEINEESIKKIKSQKIENVTQAKKLNKYLPVLEDKHVFFSAPLDIDYLMLSSFEQNYKELVSQHGGPTLINNGKRKSIRDYEKTDSAYIERLEKDVKSTLKEKATSGASYSVEEKALMIWYVYFFLGRGKTTTHIEALERLNGSELEKGIPDVIKRLCEQASRLLNIGETNHD